MVKRLIALVSTAIASSAVLAALPLHSIAETFSLTAITRFEPGSKVAEIVSASPNGRILIYTNSEEKQLGFVNLTDPARPALLAAVDLSNLGEPTSVAIAPNGQLAIAAVKNDPQPGKLVFVNPETRQVIGQVELHGVGPDSIAITPDGRRVVVAIEDEEDTDNLPGQRPGSVNIVTINPSNPSGSTVTHVPISLAGIAGVNYVNDPQPEFVAINRAGTMAAVTLQENNAIALIDLNTAQVIRIFSAGTISHDRADLQENEQVQLNEPIRARREPDAIAFTEDGQYLVTANEGDTSRGSFGDDVWSGGRGWSIFDLQGNVVYEDNGALEKAAADQGRYPDGRSARRGIEAEGLAVGKFGNREMAFIISERGSFVAAYDISDVRSPRLVGFLPTGDEPEGIIALPSRGLIVTANEGDGTLDILQLRP